MNILNHIPNCPKNKGNSPQHCSLSSIETRRLRASNVLLHAGDICSWFVITCTAENLAFL